MVVSLAARLKSNKEEEKPRRALRGGISKVSFHEVYQLLAIFPHKNEEMAPRTRTGYPHEGSCVVRQRQEPGAGPGCGAATSTGFCG